MLLKYQSVHEKDNTKLCLESRIVGNGKRPPTLKTTTPLFRRGAVFRSFVGTKNDGRQFQIPLLEMDILSPCQLASWNKNVPRMMEDNFTFHFRNGYCLRVNWLHGTKKRTFSTDTRIFFFRNSQRKKSRNPLDSMESISILVLGVASYSNSRFNHLKYRYISLESSELVG